MQDGVLPADNSVAGGMADLYQCCSSTFSCDRHSLFEEAEWSLLHKGSSSASVSGGEPRAEAHEDLGDLVVKVFGRGDKDPETVLEETREA